MARFRGMIVGVVLLAVLVVSCSSNGSSTTGSSAAASGGGGSGGGGSTATVTAQNFAFSPSSINVSAGTVTVTVTNKDTTEHTFTLDDGSSSTVLQPGTTQTITLHLSKTVGWHCKIHPTMTGTINVS